MVECWVIFVFLMLHYFVQVFCNKYILFLIIITANWKILNDWERNYDHPAPGLSTCGRGRRAPRSVGGPLQVLYKLDVDEEGMTGRY